MLLNINNFGSFQSDVWGTVSDWVMIGVTFATAVAIWLTFKEQLIVTKAQKNLLDIELIKLRAQFRTELLLSGGNTWTDVNTVWINLTAVNHEAYNVKITNQPDSDFEYEFLNTQFRVLKVSDWTGIIEHKIAHEKLVGNYHMIVSFEDPYGNQYRQIITGAFTNPVISMPTFIGNRKTKL